MKINSLRFRLMALAATAISLVVAVTGIAFYLLFQWHVERLLAGELDLHFQRLLANTVVDADGTIRIVGKLSDPRFAEPNGGLYWQVNTDGQQPIRSQSLWDGALELDNPPTPEDPNRTQIIVGPLGTDVFALERLVSIPVTAETDKRVLYTVAQDRSHVSNAITGFATSTIRGLGLVYAALLAGSALMIALGLRPLTALRKGIEAVRTGKVHRLAENVPTEIAPLVVEVNGLVAAREKQLERARQKASNMAHGLKTPLAVMMSIADDLKRSGHMQEANEIRQTASQMHDLVERELAKSRLSDGSSTHRADLPRVISRVIETLRRAPRGDVLEWRVDITQNTELAIDPTDLTELLGCVLDNARKHAASVVRVSYDGATLCIDDDGPGVDDDKLNSILKRGVRLDSTKPGSGLGLAIVSDLADVYEFDLSVARSPLGGLRVSAGIPPAPSLN